MQDYAISHPVNNHPRSYQQIEGSQSEWCISSIMYSRDTPFWSDTLEIIQSISSDFIDALFQKVTVNDYDYTHPVSIIARDRLAGLVVRASASGAEDPGFKSRLRWDFSGLSHTSDLEIGSPVATLPGTRQYRVSVGTGQRSVSIL